MEAARRLAFAFVLILPAALVAVMGLASCSDRTVPSPVPVAVAAPLPAPPEAKEESKPAKPAEPEAKPTPEEVAEFQKPAPK